jgi:hypothetical protein
MVLKVWDDRENTEGWIWFDNVKAVRHEKNRTHCVAKNPSNPEGEGNVAPACIYGIKDGNAPVDGQAKVDREIVYHPGTGKMFGSWMFSGTRLVKSFSMDDFTPVEFLHVIYNSGEEQILVLMEGHPSCYLLSDSGKTIERI